MVGAPLSVIHATFLTQSPNSTMFKRISQFLATIRYKNNEDYRTLNRSLLFDAKYYVETYEVNTDPILHYLTVGYQLGYNPSPEFDTERYQTAYLDVYRAGMNPLVHYERYGRKEGRRSFPIIPPVEYKLSEYHGETILLFPHELSLTGSPIALLNMAKVLKTLGKRVMVFSPVHGPLETELKRCGIEYVVEPKCFVKLDKKDEKLLSFFSSFKLIIFNTIVTLFYVKYLNTCKPKIMWVHEGSYIYEGLKPFIDVREAFVFVDKVYSVGSYSKSYTDQYIPADKSGTLLYGLEDISEDLERDKTSNEKLTFGIFGTCHERKGTHLFVEAISQLPSHIKRACAFKVVGKIGENDFSKKILANGAENGIVFTGELSHDATLKEMASVDVVVCPSLDDPMPIVCTEAMQLRKTIIVSNHTGTASFIEHGKNGFICHVCHEGEECNLQSVMAEVFAAREQLTSIGEAAHEIYSSHFTMKKFKETLDYLLKEEWT